MNTKDQYRGLCSTLYSDLRTVRTAPKPEQLNLKLLYCIPKQHANGRIRSANATPSHCSAQGSTRHVLRPAHDLVNDLLLCAVLVGYCTAGSHRPARRGRAWDTAPMPTFWDLKRNSDGALHRPKCCAGDWVSVLNGACCAYRNRRSVGDDCYLSCTNEERGACYYRHG